MMARENLQKTLRREREADARYAAHIDALMAANKRRHQSRMLLAQLAGTGLVPVAHYSDNDDLCDHPCPEYLNGEDCRCTPACDESASHMGDLLYGHCTDALRATDDERGTT